MLFEAGEQVEDFGCFEDPVTLLAKVALVQHPHVGKGIDRVGGSCFGSADQLAGRLDRDDRHSWQHTQKKVGTGVRSDTAELRTPGCNGRGDVFAVSLSVSTGSVRGRGEGDKPLDRGVAPLGAAGFAQVAEPHQSVDVVVGPRCQHEADWRHEVRGVATRAMSKLRHTGARDLLSI